MTSKLVTILKPGDTIGILGGGQLARMMAVAAAGLGLKTHIYSPDPDSPAFAVAAARTVGQYEDRARLTSFAQVVNAITYEFENVPAATVEILDPLRPVRPGGKALQITQDRLFEKDFIRSLGFETAPYIAVDDAGGLARAVAQLGRPSILKTRRFGYDGKGQATVREGSDLAVVFRSLGQSSILEGVVAFSREVSVVAARTLDGGFEAYSVCENHHENGILSRSRVPARIEPQTEQAAIHVAKTIAEALDYIGVLAVELFVVPDQGGERLVVNEIAPRVHNSGHWTLGGSVTSQFEQHIRAVCGWPLGSTQRFGPVEMRNLIGADVNEWREILAQPGANLQLYGKDEARLGRKMGHVTRILTED